MSKFSAWWKASPAVRAGTRAVAVAVIGYAVAALKVGVTDWQSFAGGLLMAGLYAVAALLTPLEPFVGKKTKNVKVPVPPAKPTV